MHHKTAVNLGLLWFRVAALVLVHFRYIFLLFFGDLLKIFEIIV